MKQYTMNDACKVAEEGTLHIISFLKKNRSNIEIHNVELDPEYQEKDIDLVVVQQKDHQKETITIEIKVDNYFHTGNYFFETLSNVQKNTLGCFLYSEADFLFYYFLNKELHIFRLKEAREWFINNQHRFHLKRTSTPIKGAVYETEGALVSRKLFLDEFKKVKIIPCNELL